MSTTSTPVEGSLGGLDEKPQSAAHIDRVDSDEKPGHPHHNAQGGLRSYGDDEDHETEPPVSPAICIMIFR
jgi:hypothetical protein